MLEHALIMAGIQANDSHKAAVEVHGNAVAQAEVEALDGFAIKFIAGAVLDIEGHVQGIIKNVLQAHADALLSNSGPFQRGQISGELGGAVAAQGTDGANTAEDIQRIAQASLAKHHIGLPAVGHEGLAVAGEALVAPIHGIVLIEAPFLVFENQEIFAAVESSRDAHPPFKFVIFKQVFQIAF